MNRWTHRLTARLFAAPLAGLLGLALLVGPAPQASAQALPDPDGKDADMSKPVQVYILMGQSNMLGFGKPDVLKGIAAEKYPYLVDDAGNWTTRKDVRNTFIMVSGNKKGGMKDVKQNNWLSVVGRFGPEIGIGHHLGNATDAPVLILKSCIGNRSLGWDLLPPGSEPYEHGGKIQPGYRGTPDDPQAKGEPKGWYAGCQYDGDVASAKFVLENLDKFYPGATKYEVKGFFWWQGDKDMRVPAHYERYGKNLVQLIRALRKDFDAPNALFVTASLGQTKMGKSGGDGAILNAMKAVAESDHEELKGKVAFVYTHPLSKGGSSSGHYGGNPETYMNVGQAMGAAMVKLLQAGGGKNLSGGANSGDAGDATGPKIEKHEVREWTGRNGAKLKATFVSATKTHVVLRFASGKDRKFKIRSFSDEDQDYIKRSAGSAE